MTNKTESSDLGCWSCLHYRKTECDIGRRAEFAANFGNLCIGFDYEPGSDEAENENAGSD